MAGRYLLMDVSDGAVRDISDSVFSIVTEEHPACGGSWLGANYVGSDTFNAVTYGGGKFVAVGKWKDGTDW
jgi:hypothetical protein